LFQRNSSAKKKTLLCYHGDAFSVCIVDSYMCVNNTEGTLCSMAAMVT